jgi:flagellar hook-basal body complex protein FliE
LIFLKLYAAVDSEGPQSVHYQDLLALRPTSKELAAAARWAKSQDTSAEFAQLLKEVLGHVRRDQQESH